MGRHRPDVAEVVQNRDAELSGFEFRMRLDPPRRRVHVSVVLLDGTRAELATVKVAVADPPAVEDRPPLPFGGTRRRPSPIRLLCAARSLDHGGSQLRLRELVRHLVTTRDFDILVMSPTEGPLRSALEAAGAVVSVAGAIPTDDVSAYEWRLTELRTWAAGRFDLVFGATLSAFPVVDLAERLGLPSVWRIGERESLDAVSEWLGERLDPRVAHRAHRAFESASVVLFPSCKVLEAHRERKGAGRFALLGSGTDVRGAQEYAQSTPRETCRRDLGVDPHVRLLVCAGTLWPIKGQHLLVSALAHLGSRRGLELVLIGQEGLRSYGEALARLARSYGIGDAVRILPFSHDLRPWWRAADLAALPSESEGMPAAALEAMSFGLPLLGSRVGGIPELVAPGVTGWLCEPSDLASLVAGLEAVSIATPGEVEALGARAVALVRRDYDRVDALARMTDLLRDVSRGSCPEWVSGS